MRGGTVRTWHSCLYPDHLPLEFVPWDAPGASIVGGTGSSLLELRVCLKSRECWPNLQMASRGNVVFFRGALNLGQFSCGLFKGFASYGVVE